MKKAVASESYSGGLRDGGNRSMYVEGDAFRDMMQADFDRSGKVIRETGTTIE